MKSMKKVRRNLKPVLSKKATSLGRAGSRLWGEKAASYRKEGVDVLTLSGAPTGCPGENVLEAASKAVRENGKCPSMGLLELREAIAIKLKNENGFKADPETEILVTSGAMQALYIIMTGLLNPGDEVLMASPSFFYDGIIKLVGGRPVFAVMSEEKGFQLETDMLEEMVGPKTKILIVNTPANPTGYVATLKNLEAIAEIAERNNLIVISDESYEKLVYDGRKHYSFASIQGMKERTITVQSFTKSYSMPGWRVGYLIGPSEIVRCLQKVLEWMVLTCNYVSQKAAVAALTGPQDWVSAITADFEDNRNQLMKGLAKIETISCVKPKAGPFAFINISKLGMKPENFSGYILREYGIRTTPGPTFNSDDHIRLAFGGRKEDIEKAVERLKRAAQKIVRE